MSGFGTLFHWHESSTKARIIIKVLMPTTDDVPKSLLVSVETAPAAKVWDVPCNILHETNVVLPGDELPPPMHDLPCHPRPASPPRWMATPAAGSDNVDLVNIGTSFPT